MESDNVIMIDDREFIYTKNTCAVPFPAFHHFIDRVISSLFLARVNVPEILECGSQKSRYVHGHSQETEESTLHPAR